VALAASATGLHAQASAARRASEPTPSAIVSAIESVKKDPNLATTRTIKTLRWRNQPSVETGTPAWLQWIAGLVLWLNQSARLLIWVTVIILVSLLAVALIRMVRRYETRPGSDTRLTPTHVQDFDIRPETLPANIGAAARELWDRGAHRAALALLYRGLLSRLAHVHHMPIRDSSTEGECLAYARRQLSGLRHEYVARLIAVWQRAVYAHEPAEPALVYALCDDFSAALDADHAERTS
jgi:hypothetical protein